MAENGGQGTDTRLIAFVVVTVAVMLALSGYGIILMMEKLGAGTPEYKQSWTYTFTGTRTAGSDPFEIQGTGESEYLPESDTFRTYRFTFDQTVPEDTFRVKADLICDSDGTPIDLYTPDGEGDGVSYWKHTQSDVEYRFGMKDGKAVSVEITAEDYTIKASIVQ